VVVLADVVLVAVGVSGGHHLHGKGHRERGHRIQRSDGGSSRADIFGDTGPLAEISGQISGSYRRQHVNVYDAQVDTVSGSCGPPHTRSCHTGVFSSQRLCTISFANARAVRRRRLPTRSGTPRHIEE
jgi:hypothetical protein